jgi:HK97 gp10 family phage protein
VADLQVDGMQELLAKLQVLGDKASRVENQALKVGAEPLAEAIRRNVNVSNRNETHIRDDIQISGVKTKDGVKYVEVGPGMETAWRAKFLEFGTSKMQPYPFMQPAVDETKDEVIHRMKNEIRQALGL